ncbi:histone H1-I-like [Mizuhopecten yessoensis]|uniref:Histone H1oo n=1 Tax=Mizuhopecten yessoensis TaxID=6573 RepID=A0A210QL57_MIZYE|nr:histone H1-I-like [Mizuhopecten yessoensis]OWF49464.1 Histone H1oo [Mizuhopecten yessoensis]
MAESDSSPKKAVKPKMPSQHPTYLSMAVEAVTTVKDAKGVSVPAIRNFITEKYKTVDVGTLRFRLKQALAKAVEKETIVKSKATAEKPLLVSRFNLNKEKLLALEKAKAKKEKAKEKAEQSTKKTTVKKMKSTESPQKKTKTTKAKTKTSPKKATKTKKIPKTPEKVVKAKAKATTKSAIKTIKTPKKTTKKSASGKVKAK